MPPCMCSGRLAVRECASGEGGGTLKLIHVKLIGRFGAPSKAVCTLQQQFSRDFCRNNNNMEAGACSLHPAHAA